MNITLPFHDPVAIFAAVLIIVLLAPIVSNKFKIPPIVGLILAGVIFGPYGIGILARDKAIELLSTIGLLYIMFLSGLEIELEQFKRNKKESFLFGLLTFLIPMSLGIIAGYYILNLPLLTSILLASMFSSHTLLTFPIISQLGLSKKVVVVITVGGTIITDLLALLILAVITGETSGNSDIFTWGKLILFSILFTAVIFAVIPFVGRIFFKNTNGNGMTEYIFVMAILFISGTLAEMAGLEPIIGAFIAGLTLNRLIPENSILMNRIKFVGNSMFIPFFLLSVGMLVNPFLIFQGEGVIFVAVTMIAVAILSKYLASHITGKILKFSNTDKNISFGLSVNQAAATLAVVLVGYEVGLFSDTIITGTILMILVTCMVGAWVTTHYAQKSIAENENKPFDEIEVPQRILVPICNSETAESLMNLSFLIRNKNSVEPVYPINVVSSTSAVEEQIAKGEKILAPAVVHAISAGVPVVPVTRSDINIANGIVKAATDLRISEIIMGHHIKESFYTALTGGITDRIIRQSKQMVLVSRLSKPLNITDRIIFVIPPLVDKHTGFEKMVTTAGVLAAQLSAKILLIYNGDTNNDVKKIFNENKIAVHIDEYKMEEFKSSIMHALERNILPHDLILLGVVRSGEIGWQPMLQRLPKKITSDMQSDNFIMMFASAEQSDTDGYNSVETNIPEILHGINKRFTDFNISKKNLSDAIKLLLSRAYRAETLTQIADTLNRVSYEEPVELCEGVVLLHAHLDNVKEYQIFVGVNNDGFELPPLAPSKPFAFFMLLAPNSQQPEKHLAVLEAIAKIVQRKGFTDSLKKARSLREFKSLIAKTSE